MVSLSIGQIAKKLYDQGKLGSGVTAVIGVVTFIAVSYCGYYILFVLSKCHIDRMKGCEFQPSFEYTNHDMRYIYGHILYDLSIEFCIDGYDMCKTMLNNKNAVEVLKRRNSRNRMYRKEFARVYFDNLWKNRANSEIAIKESAQTIACYAATLSDPYEVFKRFLVFEPSLDMLYGECFLTYKRANNL